LIKVYFHIVTNNISYNLCKDSIDTHTYINRTTVQNKMNSFIAFAFALVSLAGTTTAAPVARTKNTRKAKMMSKLMEGAEPTENSQLPRRLDENEIDLTGYEVKFEECQYVKAYNDELAENQEVSSVLATQRFIVFRLCPSGSCESCSYNFGEYVIDLDNYLMAATEYFVQDRENFCGMCNDICEADDDAVKSLGLVDCDECYTYCAAVENMEDNGYIESYEFTECMQVYESDDGASSIYAGAMCSDSGTSIKVGAFTDEECSTYKNVDIENYLENGLKFDDEILEKVVDSENCVSCIMTDYEVPDMDADDAAQDDAAEVEVNEMCENLYEMSAKCESKYGFDNYWKDYEEYVNQYSQEDSVCDFITSLESGSYDQYGEISLSGSKRNGSGGASGGQKFALTAFVVGTIGIGAYAASLHSQLTKGGGKADLSTQGGAMA